MIGKEHFSHVDKSYQMICAHSMDAKAELGPPIVTKRKLFAGLSGLATLALGGLAFSRSRISTSSQPSISASGIEITGIDAAPINPYEGLLSETSPHGKFITDPNQDPNRVVRTLDTPDQYVDIYYFVNPTPGKTNGATLRRFPFHMQPKGQEGTIENIDPKSINPDGLVVVRVSGEDYGGGNSITISHKRTMASGAVWYLIGKMVPLDKGTLFTPVNPFTGKPLEREKELPYVMSRNMFEPKSQKWNNLTTKTNLSTFSK